MHDTDISYLKILDLIIEMSLTTEASLIKVEVQHNILSKNIQIIFNDNGLGMLENDLLQCVQNISKFAAIKIKPNSNDSLEVQADIEDNSQNCSLKLDILTRSHVSFFGLHIRVDGNEISEMQKCFKGLSGSYIKLICPIIAAHNFKQQRDRTNVLLQIIQLAERKKRGFAINLGPKHQNTKNQDINYDPEQESILRQISNPPPNFDVSIKLMHEIPDVYPPIFLPDIIAYNAFLGEIVLILYNIGLSTLVQINLKISVYHID